MKKKVNVNPGPRDQKKRTALGSPERKKGRTSGRAWDSLLRSGLQQCNEVTASVREGRKWGMVYQLNGRSKSGGKKTSKQRNGRSPNLNDGELQY